MYDLTAIEVAVLDKLLSGDDSVLECLRSQLRFAKILSREHTGVGQYSKFTFTTPVVPLEGQPSFCFGDVRAAITGVPNGAGFLLWIEQGLISELEAYTYQEEMPITVDEFVLMYNTDGERDIGSLRRTADWAGWPGLIS